MECLNRVVALQGGLRLARRLVAGSLQNNTTTLCVPALPPLHMGVRGALVLVVGVEHSDIFEPEELGGLVPFGVKDTIEHPTHPPAPVQPVGYLEHVLGCATLRWVHRVIGYCHDAQVQATWAAYPEGPPWFVAELS